ncbi:39S ribosomal protein L34, mitochondrial [Spea bombifrons]|uniref:39S ribosomal protein L34, mitochondrial n=1 Tax=Spea bombifrons TaxID=233779 RepID=UPI00234BABFD|nr:39S ribosomal protein L34, mitochondrial [Spea bombifrons]
MGMLGVLSRLLLVRQAVPPVCAQQRTFANLSQAFNLAQAPSSSQAAGNGILTRSVPSHWSLQLVRNRKRGMEYQPKFLKRKRTHGWLKRISTRGGIEVILRRMLKGRKSLTH